MSEVIRSARRTLFEEYFPDYEEIAAGEALILRKGDSVVKLYDPKYSREVIEKYVRVTNDLVDKTKGKNVVVSMPDGNDMNFALVVSSVHGLEQVKDGRLFTLNDFVSGGNITELHDQSRLSRLSWFWLSSNDKFMKLLEEYGINAISPVISSVQSMLLDQLPEFDRDAIRLHPDNVKIVKNDSGYQVIVTDISCSIRTIKPN